jgi:hypothetical protein
MAPQFATVAAWLATSGSQARMGENEGTEMTICGLAVQWGNAPQWVAVLIAVGALVTAIVSISTQKKIARKRAATDFFLKTEMDRETLESNKKYTDAVEKLKMIVTDSGEMQNSFANSNEYWAIRDYLNLHELMSVGLLNGVFDNTVCYDFWSGELVQAYEDTLPLIKYVQKQKNGENAYSELTKIAKRWQD